MNFYSYKLQKCLLTWHSAQCTGDEFCKIWLPKPAPKLGVLKNSLNIFNKKTVTKGGVYELKNLSPAVVYNRPTCLLAGLTLGVLPNAATKVGFCWVFCARGSYHDIILPPLVYSIHQVFPQTRPPRQVVSKISDTALLFWFPFFFLEF